MTSEDKFKEIQLVEELGEKIGYGNMMGIASALWARKLNDYNADGISSGAFVPTLFGFIKDECWSITRDSVLKEYKWVDEYFKENK